MIEHGVEIDSLNAAHESPLHVASGHGNKELLELLLSHGAGLERRDREGRTPLLTAASAGHSGVMKHLVTAGAETSAVDKEDRSGLYLAAENNNLRCVKTLLKTGVRAELLERNDRWDNTALHIASIRGHLDIVTALIEAGAQIDNKNEDEQTPLHVAAKHGKLK